MIAMLFRLDPSIRNLWSLLLLGLVAGGLLRSALAPLPDDPAGIAGEARSWITFSLGVVWFCALLVLMAHNLGTRTSRFYLGLPIPARRLWWVRMASLLLVSTIPMATATLVVSIRFSAGGSLPQLEPFFVLLGVKACSGLILIAVLSQTPQPQLQRIRRDLPYLVYVGVVSLLVLLLVTLTPVHLLPVLLLLVPSVALLAHLHRSIPKSLLLFPEQPETDRWVPPTGARRAGDSTSESIGIDREVPVSAEDPAFHVASRQREKEPKGIVQLTLLRVLLGHWQSWLFAPLIFAYAFLLLDGYFTTRDPVPNLLFITIWPFVLSYQAMIRMYRLDHLPVPRKAIFPHIFLAGILPILLGLAVGRLVMPPLDRADSRVVYGSKGLEVPLEFWEVSWDGEVPLTTAPWGETHSPTRYPVFPGSRAMTYLPYETTEEQSVRFMALQVNRALEAVHGDAPYTVQEIARDKDNPLVESMRSRDEFRKGFPIEASVGRGSPVRLRTWLAGFLILIWIWGVVAAVWMLQFRPSGAQKFFRYLFVSMVAVWGALLGLHVVCPVFGILRSWEPARLPAILLRHFAEAYPVRPGLTFLLAAASALLFYLVLSRIFETVEAPLNKIRPAWKEYG